MIGLVQPKLNELPNVNASRHGLIMRIADGFLHACIDRTSSLLGLDHRLTKLSIFLYEGHFVHLISYTPTK